MLSANEIAGFFDEQYLLKYGGVVMIFCMQTGIQESHKMTSTLWINGVILDRAYTNIRNIPKGISRLSNECGGVENSVKLKVEVLKPGLVGFKYFLCFRIILYQLNHRTLS